MDESFNEEVKAFRRACNFIRIKPPGPDKIQALRELTEKQGKKQLGETRALQNVLLEYVGVEIDDDDFTGRNSKGTNMKVIYDKQTGTLLDATHVLLGDIDPYEQSTDAAMVKEVLRQDRPLLQKVTEDKKGCQEPAVSQEPLGVWICYITDNYGDPILVKLVSTDVQAMEWVNSKPRPVGVMDDETRRKRFVEYHTVEVERP